MGVIRDQRRVFLYDGVHGNRPRFAPFSPTTASAPSSTAGSSGRIGQPLDLVRALSAGRRTSVVTLDAVRAQAVDERRADQAGGAGDDDAGAAVSRASGQRRLERDLDAGEGLRDRAVRPWPLPRSARSPRRSRPGTTAFTLRWLPVMPVPGLNVTDAVVFDRSGGVPFSASASENAMLKQDEWAAASSSSGVVVVSSPRCVPSS